MKSYPHKQPFCIKNIKRNKTKKNSWWMQYRKGN